jgi:alkylated DNA repair dioxygenase AlkB
MAWHSDDEKVMQENGIIASISLGADRFFEFKHKTLDIRQKILLENGSLLVMQGETQKYYLHQLPKSKKVQEARINLTFRRFEEGDKHHRN